MNETAVRECYMFYLMHQQPLCLEHLHMCLARSLVRLRMLYMRPLACLLYMIVA
jgi:hypothetical protein